MARTVRVVVQEYPRLPDGKLDDTQLVPHTSKIPEDGIKRLITSAIENASRKSSREILSIPPDASPEEIEAIYQREGLELFKYFRRYVGDPAATAHQIYQRHYREVGVELFRNRTLQKERMNSGWRYQYLSVDCALASNRFRSVSDIGAAEGDFNAIIDFIDSSRPPLTLYVSVKNRSNTMGGQDWPKAIYALEQVAIADKNRVGPYCCVFGIAMDKGQRNIKHEQKTKRPHSVNTEIWLSDYFWPFFANYSYEEIMRLVLDVLFSTTEPLVLSSELPIPEALLDVFGAECRTSDLLDENDRFSDAYRLVEFFCNPPPTRNRKKR